MPWLKFFAAPADFPPLIERFLTQPTRFYEVYSEPGHHAREFAAPEAVLDLPLGEDPHGTGVAFHFALWTPFLMPAPSVRRIELRGPNYPPGSWRETVEGCGLFWLQTGGLHDGEITASSLGWFTERAAEKQCAVEPGPKSVNWQAHSLMAKTLKRIVQHELAAAVAGPHPVLRDALQRHRAGCRLITALGTKGEFRVEAA